MSYKAVASLITAHDRFLLLIHHSPDGDAVASSLALYQVLKTLGKQADIVCTDMIPEQFAFLPYAYKVKTDFLVGDYDVIVTLDCGDSRRTGFSARLKEFMKQPSRLLVNIDHHAKNDLHSLATHNVVDESAPATAYLIYKLAQALEVTITHKIATCLLTGLYTDTGGFKHPNTTPEALQFAAHLLACGARLKDITSNITQASSVPRLKLWGLALGRIQRHRRLNVISTFLGQDDLTKVGATLDDVSGIVTLLMTIPCDVAMLVLELADRSIQVRMRTKAKHVNLIPLATYLGGGGQKKAAGFSVRSREVTSR